MTTGTNSERTGSGFTPSVGASPAVASPTVASPAVAFGVLSLAAVTYALQASMVSPALPEIGRDLGVGSVGRSWIMTIFLLSASAATPILGRLGDVVGRKRMLVVTLAAFGSGSVLAALATTLPMMLVGRAVQGAAAAIFPLAFGVIRDSFPREQVGGRIGLLSAMLGVGAGLGISAAGPIVSHLGYHWLFWLPAGVIAIVLVATIKVIPDSGRRAGGGVSLPGGLLLVGWLMALLIGVSQGPIWGWTSPRVLGLFATTAILLPVWIATERRAAHPLVDMRMMAVPTVLRTNITAVLFGFAVYAMVMINPAFVETPTSAGYGFGASVSQAGLYLLPSTMCILLGSVASTRLAPAIGVKAVLVVGALFGAGGSTVFLLGHDHSWLIYLGSGLFGTGLGFGFSAMSQLVVAAVPADQTGIASGMNNNIRTIGGSIGTTVTASILAAGTTAGEFPREAAYSAAWAVVGAGFLIAAAVATSVPGQPRHPGRVRAGVPTPREPGREVQVAVRAA